MWIRKWTEIIENLIFTHDIKWQKNDEGGCRCLMPMILSKKIGKIYIEFKQNTTNNVKIMMKSNLYVLSIQGILTTSGCPASGSQKNQPHPTHPPW